VTDTSTAGGVPSLEQIRSPVRALEAATRAISVELELVRVLQQMADSVRELVNARYAALGIVGEDGRIEQFITSGITPAERRAIGPLQEGHGLLGTIIRDGVTLRIPDISKHPETFGFPPNHPPMHSLLGVPVRIGGETIGNFYLTEKQGADAFSQDDEDLVELFALHAGIAIQHARLHGQVQSLALLNERLRIGRDLHDGIIQAIYAVSLSLEEIPELIAGGQGPEAAERADRAIDQLHRTISDIRRFITELEQRSPGPPFQDQLEAVARELHGESDVELRLDLRAADAIGDHLAPEVAHELIQIAREALSNVARHSGARHASISLVADGNHAVLEVTDDGRGFDPKRRLTGHFGLANLRDRAALVRGTTRIESGSGKGTRIIVRLPMLDGEGS